jgi:hypothetical protein
MPSHTRPQALTYFLVTVLLAAAGPGPLPAQTAPAIGTWEFSYPVHDPKSLPELDLRSLNEKEAGQSGFIQRTPDGNGFALGDGTPVRFWAVGTDVYRQSPENVATHARFLAKMGVNLVRIHTQAARTEPGGRINEVNTQVIDAIWRFVAAAKKEGIYTTISPYWATGRDVSNWGIEGYSGSSDLWGLLFFNETLQAAYKEWVKALYTEKNPYTGIPLAHDPAVAIIQVQNEDSLLFWTLGVIKPAQRAVLGRKLGAWLARKYGSLEGARRAWEGVGHKDDDFARGVVGIHDVWFFTQPQAGGLAKRLADELTFLASTQRGFYADMASYYHDTLGCRQLVNASNWKSADPVRLEDVERWTYTAGEVSAVNRYYMGGVHLGENSTWSINPGHRFSQQSVLLDPREFPLNLKQSVGHPMILTESSWVAPLAYQTEAPFLVSVYQSLTGVDAYYWFCAMTPEYSQGMLPAVQNTQGQLHLYKWELSLPTLMGQFPAAALMYRKVYIKQGEPVVHEERTLASLWNREPPIIAEGRSFDPNRDRGFLAGTSELRTGVDPLAFLVGPVEVKYDGDPSRTRVIDLAPYIDNANKVVKSVTGEIMLDRGKGLCTLDAPRAQGACGFLNRFDAIRLRDVAIRCRNGYATVMLVALDDQPIASSKKILVQVGTSARPNGWRTRTAEFAGEDGKTKVQGFEIVKTGAPPWRIVNSEVGLVVRNPTLAKATLLDPAGYAVNQVAGSRTGDDFSVQLPLNTMYLILEAAN